MPCNLAVSITKAAVTQAHLLALLTPEVVETLVRSYLVQPGILQPTETRDVVRSGDRVYVRIGTVRFDIQGGVITTVNATTQRAQELTGALADLLVLGADSLFAQQVAATLTPFGVVTSQQVTVENGGIAQGATLITLNLQV